jgi:hypothetical protein
MIDTTGNQLATQYRIEEDRIEEKRTVSVAKATETVYSEDFISFWNIYPKKVGKGDAYRSWKRAKRPALEVVLAALTKQSDSEQWKRDNGRFIPNPGTWLNQCRWEDEITNVKTKIDKF